MSGGGGGGGGGRRIPSMPMNGRKDRDEDLLLFRELHKREKDRIASLLQPVSDEFEPNGGGGNYAFYRMASGKKGSGYEFYAENDKNDYDWLKTPPATPLFPSLEMEANAPELVVQREIPVFQPLSRFAGNSEALKGNPVGPKSPKPKTKVPLRSITPGQRPTISSADTKNTKQSQTLKHKTTQLTTDLNNRRTNAVSTTMKSTNQKQTHMDFLTSNLSKNVGTDSSKTNPRSRGVSPSMRSTIPAQIPGFPNETPPNLRTDRPISATRGRPSNPTLTVHQKPEQTPKPRRQSCSPSVMRGRKVETKQESEGKMTTQKGKIQTANGTQFLGSRMVDKVMNARKSLGVEERETKPKPSRGYMNESDGFGRLISRSSLDMALKHMEMKRDLNNSRHPGIIPGKGSTR